MPRPLRRRAAAPVPDPAVQPTMTVPEAGRVFGLSRAASYQAAKRGEIPSKRIGKRLHVPTAEIRKMLGLNPTP